LEREMPRIGDSRIVLKPGFNPQSATICGTSRKVSEVIFFMKKKNIPVKKGVNSKLLEAVCNRFKITIVDAEDAIAFYHQHKHKFDTN
jgi:hypothetical protein